MITAGEVGAVFKITNEASPILERLARQFEALDRLIEKVKKDLSTLQAPKSGLTLGPLATELEEADKAARSTATGVLRVTNRLKALPSRRRSQRTPCALRRKHGRVAHAGRRGCRQDPRRRGGDGPRAAQHAWRGQRSGHGGGASGVHFSGQSVPLPGEQHAQVSGTPLMVGAGAVGIRDV